MLSEKGASHGKDLTVSSDCDPHPESCVYVLVCVCVFVSECVCVCVGRSLGNFVFLSITLNMGCWRERVGTEEGC